MDDPQFMVDKTWRGDKKAKYLNEQDTIQRRTFCLQTFHASFAWSLLKLDGNCLEISYTHDTTISGAISYMLEYYRFLC